MKKHIACLLFTGISFISISQVKSLNSVEKPKEELKSSTTKSISESKSKPVSRAKISRKVKPVLKRENYEAVPKKD
jgi:hypothetical protein